MASVRSMLVRVRRLEQARVPASPFGSLEDWEAECQAWIEEGSLDRRDVAVVMLAVRRWHQDGLWSQNGSRGG